MNKEIKFHPYALYKMGRRRLTRSMVGETVKEPLAVVEGKFGRKIAQRVFDRYLIRVVYEEYEDHILVVTAYSTKPERYLE